MLNLHSKKTRNPGAILFAAALVFILSGLGAKAQLLLDNSPYVDGDLGDFGGNEFTSITYGQVFTATTTGTLTSFTLSLYSGVGSLYGGVGSWNGVGSPTNLYLSGNVSSVGAQGFTFAPNIAVVAGQQYVAYISTYGDPDTDPEASSRMPFVYGTYVPNIDYFVYSNEGSPVGNPSWHNGANFGSAEFTAQFAPAAAPEPSSWALGVIAFGVLVGCAWRRGCAVHRGTI